MSQSRGIQTLGAGGGVTPSSGGAIYQTVIGVGGATEVTVPLVVMVCSANTLVIYNGAILNTGFSLSGNVYTFSFQLQEGDYLIFKN
jgi:hypothetical protein